MYFKNYILQGKNYHLDINAKPETIIVSGIYAKSALATAILKFKPKQNLHIDLKNTSFS